MMGHENARTTLDYLHLTTPIASPLCIAAALIKEEPC
jgi:hypothetical protein